VRNKEYQVFVLFVVLLALVLAGGCQPKFDSPATQAMPPTFSPQPVIPTPTVQPMPATPTLLPPSPAATVQPTAEPTLVPSPESPTVPPMSVTLTRGPYLQWVTTNSIIVVWDTDVAADSRVEYGLTPEYGVITTDPTLATHHAMTLTNLLPYTFYHYRVSSGGATLGQAGTFRTAAPPMQPDFSFVVYGDTRTGIADHQSVVGLIVALAPDFVIHTGDMVNKGGDVAEWDTFFSVEQDLLRSIPQFPVIGNHEQEHGNYFDAFHLPNNERWYSFDYGQVHFVMLQVDGFADYAPGTPQYEWLENDLASSNQKWKIVTFHQPVYSSGEYGRGPHVKALQNYLVPLFERHNVSMVFSGHDHLYERSVANEITYIISGGGGAPLYDQGNDNLYSVYFDSIVHLVYVTVEGDRLSCVGIKPDGTTFDPFTLTRTAANSQP